MSIVLTVRVFFFRWRKLALQVEPRPSLSLNTVETTAEERYVPKFHVGYTGRERALGRKREGNESCITKVDGFPPWTLAHFLWPGWRPLAASNTRTRCRGTEHVASSSSSCCFFRAARPTAWYSHGRTEKRE